MKKLLTLLFILTPVFVQADTVNNLKDLIDVISDYINLIIPLLFALSVLFFLFGVFRYFIYSSDPSKRAEGAQFILWAVVALAAMLSVWGLVAFVRETIQLPEGDIQYGGTSNQNNSLFIDISNDTERNSN